MTTKVKICGLTVPSEAALVAAEGADFIGLNFWPGSKRRVTVAQGVALAAAARGARPHIGVVGLFVDADLRDVVAAVREVGLDAVQLHGDETVDCVADVASRTGVPVWKAVPVGGAADVAALDRWPVPAIVLDAPSPGRGGSGKQIDWAVARMAVEQWPQGDIVLAGGLTPDNVAGAIARVAPWAVDVASGVESAPGRKDPERVRAFLRAAREAGEKQS